MGANMWLQDVGKGNMETQMVIVQLELRVQELQRRVGGSGWRAVDAHDDVVLMMMRMRMMRMTMTMSVTTWCLCACVFAYV